MLGSPEDTEGGCCRSVMSLEEPLLLEEEVSWSRDGVTSSVRSPSRGNCWATESNTSTFDAAATWSGSCVPAGDSLS